MGPCNVVEVVGWRPSARGKTPGRGVAGRWPGFGRLSGLLELWWFDRAAVAENVFCLCVSVCLPGEHAQVVAFEPVVVESFAGVVVVEVSVS